MTTSTTTEKPKTRVYKLLHGKHKQRLGTQDGKPIYEVFNALDKNRNLVESTTDLVKAFKNKFAYADMMFVGGQSGVVTIEAAEEAKAQAVAEERIKNAELQEEIDRLNAKNAKSNGGTTPAAKTTGEADNTKNTTSNNGNKEDGSPDAAQALFDGLDLASFNAPYSLDDSLGRGKWNIDDSEGKQLLKEAVTKVVADQIIVLINKESKA